MGDKTLIYKESHEKSLKKELFQNPSKDFRGTPFWAWNCKVSKEQVDNTLSELKEMGMGGAFIHCRTGMDLPYLQKEFMDMVRYSHEEAKKKDMLTWLYDEDRWPSGFAGGLVTKEEKYRARFLVFSPTALSEDAEEGNLVMEASAKAILSGNRRLLGRYAVKIEEGFLSDYKLIGLTDLLAERYEEWFAYLEVSGNSAWFNNQAYLNTLDKEAVEQFIEVTHEAYNREFGEAFGDSIPAIFTDEPQFTFKTMLGYASDREMQTIPYTDDFEETYYAAYNQSFLEYLPEVFWDLPEGKISVSRYHYHDHVCERFTTAFADQVGAWCKKHNIMLTGHMMREPFLESQTMALGEAMRSYRAFEIPGIDMLCDRRELTTAKQAQSAVHQFDRPGGMSEIYGVTNWDFDFRRHKLAGDWQAALGVTLRVHHLTWTSMAGEAKRDYPAAIGYQSPWYKEYSYIEDHFSRLNTALTRGKPIVKIGVIHPIESYWLYWGTKEKTGDIRKEMDQNFLDLVDWLLYGLIDFDFISESLLAGFEPQKEASVTFQAGAMEYDVIVVPNCVTLRSTTLERLTTFIHGGGKVIFTGRTPEYIDAVENHQIQQLVKSGKEIRFTKTELLSALSDTRLVDIRCGEGTRTENMIYQMRADGEGRWLFLAHSEKPSNPDIPSKEELTIEIAGLWSVSKYDTLTGMITSVVSRNLNSKTIFKEASYEYDSFLYYLEPVSMVEFQKREKKGLPEKEKVVLLYGEKVPVILEEPNVLLLDMAEYRFDDGEWMPKEELLRIDNQFRRKVCFPIRTEAFAQPWLTPEKEAVHHKLSLRFVFDSKCEVNEVKLALEHAEETVVVLNGERASSKVDGWYTDRSIQTVKIGNIKKGTNILEVQMPYYSKFNVEYMYLLGDFGVVVSGRTAHVTEPVRELAFGDICVQGLPFYGGNIIYQISCQVPDCTEGKFSIEAAQFRCPVIKVSMDGEKKGYIAISPYHLSLGNPSAGEYKIELTAYGNRVNTFGPVHNCNHTEIWIGPKAWRTTGTSWSYEYQLKPSGILVSPVLTIEKKG